MAIQKDYVAAVDWANVNKVTGRIIWHNDESLTEYFSCQEDLESVKRETYKVFQKYSSMAGAWAEAYTDKGHIPVKDGIYHQEVEDIEMSVYSQSNAKNGASLVRVRVREKLF